MTAYRHMVGAALLDFQDIAGPVLAKLAEAEDRHLADLGLSGARLRVLNAAAQETQPRTVAQLARSLGLTRQAVQRLANDLETRGLVAWLRNPDHARAQLVGLTEDGRAAHAEAQRRRLALAEVLAQDLEPAWLEVASGLATLLGRRLARTG